MATLPRTFENGSSLKNRIAKAARMPYMPQDHFKITLRRRRGLNISNIGSTKIGKVIIEAVGLRSEQIASDIICPNINQKILVSSTPE
ncbi:hypothetical protein HPB49_007998 [Dermacentor silvarum]|uniref:Uncharacterized protein n=1 Tax=Dermacentor silvarum TaxID=543639 RepID=A0ACB8CW98_DERSI|nr:hypothetical protein HPB49_007998 [Dermacentor silvarum]